VDELVEEAQRIPFAAVRRAREISWIKPPDHLAHLVDRVRREHGGLLGEVHTEIDERLAGRDVDGERGAFYAASELALIEALWRSQLAAEDRVALRAPWEHLLAA
jgi:hypothetical protein